MDDKFQKLYNETLVTYDIQDNKDRTKLSDELKDIGLISIQKSVFWGYLLPAEERNLIYLFNKYCQNEDKAIYTRANLVKNISYQTVGYSPEFFNLLKSYEII